MSHDGGGDGDGIVEYAQIDWHDFVVVETISFRDDETGERHVTIT